MQDPKQIRQIFELSLTWGHRAIAKKLGLTEKAVRRVLEKDYPDSVVPLELQEKSKEARKKRRFASNHLEAVVKALRKHLIRKILEIRQLKKENEELKKEIQRLRDILDLVKTQRSEEPSFLDYSYEDNQLWR